MRILLLPILFLAGFCPVAQSQTIELSSRPVGELPTRRSELVGFRILQDSFQFKFKEKANLLYLEGTDANTLYRTDSLPGTTRRTDILWDGYVANKRRVITESYEGLGQRVIQMTEPGTENISRLFNANRQRGNFPGIRFETTDTSLILWFREVSETEEDESLLTFYEVDPAADQVRHWQVKLPYRYDLCEIYRVHRSGGVMVFTLKVYRISPIEKRGGQINYRWYISVNPIGSDELKVTELDAEQAFSGTPLIHFTDSNLIVFRIKAFGKPHLQKEIESISVDLSSGLRKSSSLSMDSLHIPKNTFTYRRRSKSYSNFLPLSLRETPNGLQALLEYRQITLDGRRGNKPIYSYFLGPMVMVHIQTENLGMSGTAIEKYQFSHDDYALYSGAFIRRSESVRDTFYFSTRHSHFLFRGIVLPVNRKATLRRCVLNGYSNEPIYEKIRNSEPRYAPVWRYAQQSEGILYVPMIRGKKVRIGTIQVGIKP